MIRGNEETNNSKKNQYNKNTNTNKNTNLGNIIIALINAIFNMQLSNAGALLIFWMIIREIYFVSRLPSDFDYTKWMFNTTETLKLLFSQSDVAIIVLFVIIIMLLVIIFFLLFRIKQKQDEIDRISAVRNEVLFSQDKGLMQSLRDITEAERESVQSKREIAAVVDGGNKDVK